MTTIQDRIKTVLTNYGSCLNNIGFDEFPSILSITFGNRDKDKREIDDLSDKATKKIVDLIKEVEEETKGDILNNLHAFVCDMATSEQSKSLAKEDCLELIRYQIERIYGKKLLSITNKEKQK